LNSSAGGNAGVSRREALRWMGLAGFGVAFGAGSLRAGPADGADKPVNGAGAAGGLEQPAFYRFKIGAFDAIAFNDGAFNPPVAQSPFGVDEPVEAKVAVLREAFLPVASVNLQFNVLLVHMGAEWVLFDAGCGSVFGEAGGRLAAQMAAAGVKPEQITAVFLSHAHGDHFGGLLDAEKRPVFTNATHYVGRTEYDFWMGANPDMSGLHQPEDGRKGMVDGARGALTALKGKWHFIAGGDKILDGLEIIDAPGHTPGHLVFLISSGGEQLLHFVDAAHHHAITFARPEWVLAFDVQPKLAEATRRKLFDRAAADRLRVFGAHMPFPSLGHVKALEGGRYDYVISPWLVT
jgi:glyoxylase-like metal-dependent hydrolase (beta-lactamase superfamily II)